MEPDRDFTSFFRPIENPTIFPLQSAGIALHRLTSTGPEVLLHPGGPFWAKKDAGAWSIPKGLIEAGETPLAAARREFAEELVLRRLLPVLTALRASLAAL